MSGAIPYGRALAAAAGAAQGQQQNIARMLGVWQAPTVQDNRQVEEQRRAGEGYLNRLRAKAQAQQDERNFEQAKELELLRQSGRPGAGTLEERLNEYEAKKAIAAKYPSATGGGFKPNSIEEAAKLAGAIAAARAPYQGYKPSSMDEVVDLSGKKAKAEAEARQPTAVERIEKQGEESRKGIAVRGGESRKTNEAKGILDRLRDTSNWDRRDKAQTKALDNQMQRTQMALAQQNLSLEERKILNSEMIRLKTEQQKLAENKFSWTKYFEPKKEEGRNTRAAAAQTGATQRTEMQQTGANTRDEANLRARYAALQQAWDSKDLDRVQRVQIAEEANQIRMQIAQMNDATRQSEGAANRGSREGMNNQNNALRRDINDQNVTSREGISEANRQAGLYRDSANRDVRVSEGALNREQRVDSNTTNEAGRNTRDEANRQARLYEGSANREVRVSENEKKSGASVEKSRAKAVSEMRRNLSSLAVKAEQMANAEYRAATDPFKGGALVYKKDNETPEQFEARRNAFLEDARHNASRKLFHGAALRQSLAVIPTMTHEEAIDHLNDLTTLRADYNIPPEDFGALVNALTKRMQETAQ